MLEKQEKAGKSKLLSKRRATKNNIYFMRVASTTMKEELINNAILQTRGTITTKYTHQKQHHSYNANKII